MRILRFELEAVDEMEEAAEWYEEAARLLAESPSIRLTGRPAQEI